MTSFFSHGVAACLPPHVMAWLRRTFAASFVALGRSWPLWKSEESEDLELS
jgi:hypothetical protein